MTPDTDVLLGRRYKLSSRIAAGGMGEVWAGTDQVLGRHVAIKVLRREYAEDPTFLERFRAEARHTAALSHAGIAAVFDYSDGVPTGPDGETQAPYLVMEHIDGEPLSAVIAREGAMNPARVFDIIGQAALALQTAHDNGVIHRDVKPGNILITAAGSVKLTDFGISRATNSVPLTRTGTIMGTAHYISPEQASGRSVTPASDLYSLGVVAYECLAGRRPFAGDTPVSVALAQVREEPPALGPGLPSRVTSLVMRMLAKDPAQRPASAGELAGQAQALSRSLAAGTGADETEVDGAGTARTMALPTAAAASPAAAGATSPAAGAVQQGTDRAGTTDTDPGFQLPAPGRTPRWAPYAAALAVAGLVLLLVVKACGGAGLSATSAKPTASPTSTGSQSQAGASTAPAPPEAVLVRASEYRGQPVSRARAALRALGLQVTLRPVSAGRSTPVGTVTGVDPTGRLSPDTAVTLDYARPTPPRQHGQDNQDETTKPDKHDKKSKPGGTGADGTDGTGRDGAGNGHE